jgi:hypothetical protein
MKNENTIKKLGALSGWFGMVLIHGATLPTTLGVILGYSEQCSTSKHGYSGLVWFDVVLV